MKKFVFLVMTIFFSAILLEGVLLILSLAIPKVGNILSRQPKVEVITPHVKDPLLGDRPNPAYFDHDKLGFRNKTVPQKIDIITLGDSQTYGTGVKRAQTWPKQLGKILSKEVYNMAYAGYGPTHSLILLKEAVRLKPRMVIEAFYAGNDLYDSFQGVYNIGQFPEFKNSDPEVFNTIFKMESKSAFKDEVDLLAPHLSGQAQEEETQEEYVSPHGSARNWVAEHSRLYGVLRAVKRAVKRYRNQQRELAHHRKWELILEDARQRPEKHLYPAMHYKVKTLLTPDYRLAALNVEDLRLQEGLRISLLVLKQMSEVLAAEGIDFVVVLIPTKEFVFKDMAAGGGGSLANLFDKEERLWQSVKAYLKENNIHFQDLLPVLRSKTNAGFQLYPLDWDGHPNPAGYRVMAESIAEGLIEK